MSDQQKRTIDLPFTPEQVRDGTARGVDPHAAALKVVGQTLADLSYQLADLRQRVAGLEALARSQQECAAIDALTRMQQGRADVDGIFRG